MRTASSILVIILAACGVEEAPEVVFGVPSGKGDSDGERSQAVAAAVDRQSPFDSASCSGSAHYPGEAQARFTIEMRRRSCSDPACTTWEPVDLDWPMAAMEGTIETIEVPYYRTESDYGYHWCCGMRLDPMSGEVKTDCGYGFCTETRSVLAGHHPGLLISNSLDNECKPWWRFWGDADPKPQTIRCSFSDGAPSCGDLAYADGCKTRHPKLDGEKIRFTEGTVTAGCARLVATQRLETGREGTYEEYQIGLLARF